MLRILLAMATAATSWLLAASADGQEVIVLPPGTTVIGTSPVVPTVVAPPATTVQLPTFNFFTISTTVMVPDRGGVYLGGVNRGAAASHSNGVPGLGGVPGVGNRGIATGYGAGGMSVGVQVHDLAAMDEQLLAEARAARGLAEVDVWATRMAQAQKSSAGRPAMSVAEARRLSTGVAPQSR